MSQVSPFAPDQLVEMPEISGVELAACEAGIRYRGRKDLMLATMPEGTTVAGVLTRSRTASAPVDWCRAQLPAGKARAVVVNSGNANAFTGRKGHEAVRLTVEMASGAVGCRPQEVMVASTGVIGEPLEASAFAAKLAELAKATSPTSWYDAAEAIMTTDTFAKVATRSIKIDGVKVKLNGIAKGSGMIAPDMGTMLAFVFTDAPITANCLQSQLSKAVDLTFNAVTVDGDTSTSDTVLVFATGTAAGRGLAPIDQPENKEAEIFASALEDLMRDLALQIVKDGEGLTKFITINVRGAENAKAARNIARAIANSPLVKTAMAGEDPNWGRIVMAVGKAGEEADRDRLSIWFGDVLVAENGEVAKTYHEAHGAAVMKHPEIEITVDVGIGNCTSTVWTCDLTNQYIAINTDYRS